MIVTSYILMNAAEPLLVPTTGAGGHLLPQGGELTPDLMKDLSCSGLSHKSYQHFTNSVLANTHTFIYLHTCKTPQTVHPPSQRAPCNVLYVNIFLNSGELIYHRHRKVQSPLGLNENGSEPILKYRLALTEVQSLQHQPVS